jgi:hypothetical protein
MSAQYNKDASENVQINKSLNAELEYVELSLQNLDLKHCLAFRLILFVIEYFLNLVVHFKQSDVSYRLQDKIDHRVIVVQLCFQREKHD